MALCLSIFSRENALLHVQCSEKELHRERELHQFAYCSVDVIEEKGRLSTSKAQELYLGVLLLNASFRSYGYLTNTSVKFVIVVDVANSNLKDQDIRAIFKRLHTSYCKAISNPFYVIDSSFESSKLRSAVAEILDQ